MGDDTTRQPGFTRRDFMRTAGAGALAMGLGADALAGANAPTSATSAARTATGPDGAGRYNILFILTDQERFFRPGELPAGVLFNYNMFAYLDGDCLLKAVAHIQAGGNAKKLKEAGIVPDMRKCGFGAQSPPRQWPLHPAPGDWGSRLEQAL